MQVNRITKKDVKLETTQVEVPAPQASERIGLLAHTFGRRAAQAVARGDKRIRKTRNGYLTTESVWREYEWPIKVGRPTKPQQIGRNTTGRPPESPESPATR